MRHRADGRCPAASAPLHNGTVTAIDKSGTASHSLDKRLFTSNPAHRNDDEGVLNEENRSPDRGRHRHRRGPRRGTRGVFVRWPGGLGPEGHHHGRRPPHQGPEGRARAVQRRHRRVREGQPGHHPPAEDRHLGRDHLRRAARRRQPPDVLSVAFTEAKSLIANKQAADLTDAIESTGVDDIMGSTTKKLVSDDDGHVYAIPTTAYSIGLVYNRDLFTKAGLDPDDPRRRGTRSAPTPRRSRTPPGSPGTRSSPRRTRAGGCSPRCPTATAAAWRATTARRRCSTTPSPRPR
ncbi:extracellular solute-binding protein [Curtobacterium flaccumfaciens]|nr:extracellular solute-binding protein [Curtobacterium flaccumfaciens]